MGVPLQVIQVKKIEKKKSLNLPDAFAVPKLRVIASFVLILLPKLIRGFPCMCE